MVDHVERPRFYRRIVDHAIRQTAEPVAVDPAFWSAVEQLDTLFYVTSAEAMREFNRQHGPEFGNTLNAMLGGRLFTIVADPPVDAFDAVEGLADELLANEAITGVVILGDYKTVPARRVECTDVNLMEELSIGEKLENAGNDDDAWWVWNDDLYGDRQRKLLPDLPVSRLPIIPATVGAPFAMSESKSVFGLRAREFPFADAIYSDMLDPLKLEDQLEFMEQSPPLAMDGPGEWTGESVDVSQFEEDMVYLVLHGLSGSDMDLVGTSRSNWRPVAVNGSVVSGSWRAPAVAFGAVCWGGLMADPIARFGETGATISPRSIAESYPLEFINHGANAFVGFTALHHVPEDPEMAALLGAPIHSLFWDNVARLGMAPAEALFQAKAAFIGTLRDDTDRLARAEELKAYWAATCIGFGW